MRDVLLLIRHGQTDWNLEGRFQGAREVPINAVGREQARRNGRVLPSLLGEHDWQFVASPLGRAQETMRIILENAGRPDQPFVTHDPLKEVCFGAWEARTLKELREADPEAVAARKRDKWNYVPPEGESYAMLAERFGEWFKTRQGRHVIVAHGGITRVALHLLSGMPSSSVPQFFIPHDRIIAIFDGKALVI
ncbi:histidine phosphatase family protein [Afifella sp. JA880]|uniref:histidine phosphatase family protein n=1 Tax=Afifella sp. JA880 TaxID=2975280 RepID=UPI0021BAAA44|nr:histidine phosphatase family protein [Afifella sp. JA880]MCT8267014.1 histidine phosphatase family protein [Afifella sp. JA880]